MNLNQVTLSASDMLKTKDFYKTLGFELVVDSPDYLRFACPNEGASFSFVKADEVHSNSR